MHSIREKEKDPEVPREAQGSHGQECHGIAEQPPLARWLPELLWHYTFTGPTSDFRQAPGMPEPTKGSRMLHIFVSRKLKPITELHGEELFDVWRQCISCHLTLWKEGVYHRDVSPTNMLWYWKDGKRIGVSNDYDFSSLADDLGPRGNERTGTVPFMAIDLLTEKGQSGEVKHMYRHDLESFVWVFIWVCLRYREGVLLPTGLRPLDKWATLDAVECGLRKLDLIAYPEEYLPSGIDTDMGAFFLDCADELYRHNGERRAARRIKLLKRRATKQSNDEEPEDIDDSLDIFTIMPSWANLIKLSNPSQ